MSKIGLCTYIDLGKPRGSRFNYYDVGLIQILEYFLKLYLYHLRLYIQLPFHVYTKCKSESDLMENRDKSYQFDI